MASEIVELDKLRRLLLSDGTRIGDNEYLESPIHFDIKRYLHSENISYSLNIHYFLRPLTFCWLLWYNYLQIKIRMASF